jgi:hypothetical protein
MSKPKINRYNLLNHSSDYYNNGKAITEIEINPDWQRSSRPLIGISLQKKQKSIK